MPTSKTTTTRTTTRKPAAAKPPVMNKGQRSVLDVMPKDQTPITAYAVCVDLKDTSPRNLEYVNETLEFLQGRGLVDDEPNSLFWHRTAKGVAA